MVRVVALAFGLALAVFTAMAGPAVPAARAADPPTARTASYELQPDRNAVAVRVEFTVAGDGATIAIEQDSTNVRFETDGGTVTSAITGTSPERREYELVLSPPADPEGDPRVVVVTYDIPGGPPRSLLFTRAGHAYATFCVDGFGTGSQITVTIPRGYAMRTWGDGLARTIEDDVVRYTNSGLTTKDWWACLGGANRDGYRREILTSPSGRRIQLESYPEDDSWRDAMRAELGTELRRVEELMGRRLPGSGALVVREVPSSDLDGYAGLFQSTEQLIRITEDFDQPGLVAHELSHAWFNEGLFERTWLAEGYAGWVEGRAREFGCSPVFGPPDGYRPDLDAWWYLPEAPLPADLEMVDFQYAAACTIVDEVMERAGDAGGRAILDAMIERRNPYGADLEGPGPNLDWREWLDLVDETGLRPAGERDLDFTQVRMARYGAADDVEALIARKVARSLYHDLLDAPRQWLLPAFVRADLAAWRFDDATRALRAATAARVAAGDAERLIPELRTALQALRSDWESAESPGDLERVERAATRLLAATERVARARVLAGAAADPMQALGLVGTDMVPTVDAALAALLAGDLDGARAQADLVIGTVEESARAGTVRATGGGITVLLVFVAANVYWRRHRHRVHGPTLIATSVPAPTPHGEVAARTTGGAGILATSSGPPNGSWRASGPPASRPVPVTPGSGRRLALTLLAVAATAVIVTLIAVAVMHGRRGRHRPG